MTEVSTTRGVLLSLRRNGYSSYWTQKSSIDLLLWIYLVAEKAGVSRQTGSWGSRMRYTTLSPRERYREKKESWSSATGSPNDKSRPGPMALAV